MRGKINGRFAPNRGSDSVEEDDSKRWLGTYGDAVTLLMAFFVMLYAMSEVDAQKFTAFVQGLEGPFGNRSITQGVDMPTNTGIVGPNSPATVVPESISTTPTSPLQQLAAAAGQQLTEEQTDELEHIEQAVDAAFSQEGLGSVADYRTTTRGLVISIASDDVLFGLGSTEISDVGDRIIGTLASVLSEFDNDVVVEGHTDDIPLTRVGYSNWNLSTDRAVAVVGELIGAYDMTPARLGAAGYADQRPRVPNDSPANRALNRRVDVLVVAQPDSDLEGATDGTD